MYNNTGEKIKNRASVACGIKIFFNVCLGLFFFASFTYFAGLTGSEFPEWAPMWLPVAFFFLAFYFALVRSIGAWNQYLLTAAYGELVEHTTKSAVELEEIKELLLKSYLENKRTPEEKSVRLEKNNELE